MTIYEADNFIKLLCRDCNLSEKIGGIILSLDENDNLEECLKKIADSIYGREVPIEIEPEDFNDSNRYYLVSEDFVGTKMGIKAARITDIRLEIRTNYITDSLTHLY